MALSNKERIGRVMDALKNGLAPFILREYRRFYGEAAIDEMDTALATASYPGLSIEARTTPAALIAALDTQACLNLLWRRWNEVFHDKLGHVARSHVSELMDARNSWAHQGAFSNDEAYRIADTAARLLKMVSAGAEAQTVEDIGRDLLRLRYDAEAKKAKKDTGPLGSDNVTTLTGLKPWRAVVQPHPDVASGRYIQAEFAADLSQVIAGIAEAEYQDPHEFFRRTYLTEGLLSLLVTGIKRLTGQGGDPVVQLQTSFGGGKTHSMLALYHLANGQLKLSDIPGGERIAAQIDHTDLPEANIAVLVGTNLDVAKPRQYRDATVHTLWGEMAYQLGGQAAYKLVEPEDRQGVSPGSHTLRDLLFQFGPSLIIIDELVAYARNLYGAERLPAGTFESVMTFMQALTEAVKAVDESLLLVSIPESNIEIGGKAGQEALNTLSHIVGRIESIWKPVTATESFEIVRRRLFADNVDYAARDAVVKAFGDMYRNAAGEFPAGVGERDYLERLRSAYPIHPELFDRLYQDWSTLERFQRTRGVLRLMAAVIHQLWSRGDQSLMIMPGTLPLDSTPARNELLRYLPDTWAAVYETDIDGLGSRPLAIDGAVPTLGRFNACRRVARTVFIGSAPSVTAQRVRGQEEIRIRLGCAQPGEPAAVFGDALRRMGVQLTYLYTDGSRYWYDTRPTVNKMARDRAQGWPEDEVQVEIINRLRKVPKAGKDFAAYHVAPADSADVADDDRVRVVVLRPDAVHKRAAGTSAAEQTARRILESRGSAQRLYKNMLIFIAPDENDGEALRQGVREYLAWQSIQAEEEALNLDAQQRRQVKSSLDKADETVANRLLGSYSWLLTPVQPEPLGGIEIQASRISGQDNFYERAVRKLKNDGLLIYTWSPDILRMELDRFIWNEARGWEVRLKQLWEYLAQYCYLPRLFDREVLVNAVRDGVGRLDAPVAYATGVNSQGHHTGVVCRGLGQIYFDENSLLVHPEHLNEPPADEPELQRCPHCGNLLANCTCEKPEKTCPECGKPLAECVCKTPPPPPPPKTTRYYGRVTVDPQRVNKEIGTIVEEVIERLTGQVGCEVEISLEVTAKLPVGFDDTTVRTISENSRTLKFDHYSFEEG